MLVLDVWESTEPRDSVNLVTIDGEVNFVAYEGASDPAIVRDYDYEFLLDYTTESVLVLGVFLNRSILRLAYLVDTGVPLL